MDPKRVNEFGTSGEDESHARTKRQTSSESGNETDGSGNQIPAAGTGTLDAKPSQKTNGPGRLSPEECATLSDKKND